LTDGYMFGVRSFADENRFAGISRENFPVQRSKMVESQLRRRGISSERVLAAMGAVPREEFVPPDERPKAYADMPLRIGNGQTISQPYIVGAMVEALELFGIERVLEVGAGCGYEAAVLSLLAREVFAMEWHEALAAGANKRLAALGYGNAHVITGDGAMGYPPAAPFDRIVVAAAAPGMPPPLREQLADGGLLVIPVGGPESQELLQMRRRGSEFVEKWICTCRFVPLLGRHGWEARPSR
jgi:protein-L-isoaspartate(D-aspartate) O-methyltransferase